MPSTVFSLRVSVSGRRTPAAGLLAMAVCLAAGAARAGTLDDIGVSLLRTAQPALTGSGVTVAAVEASSIDKTDPQNPVNLKDFEINPTGITLTPITYVNVNGDTATGYPNAVGTQSGHANIVGSSFFGTAGVAPGVDAIWNYDASYFLNQVIFADTPPTIAAKVVNQSFTVTFTDSSQVAPAEQVYDNYVADPNHNTIIVSAVGNGGGIQFPSGAYNSIGVAAFGGTSSVGPEGTRSKPDITAPGSATSFSTPLVSGVATLLVQAGNQNAGGVGSATAAVDPRTIKALLLTGATKPSDWTHSSAAPLDTRYGAGIVNAYASYRVLSAGMQPVPTLTTATLGLGQAHAPINTGPVVNNFGWAFHTITSTFNTDAVDHYLFNFSPTGKNYVFTATLDWYRPFNASTSGNLNNLDLYLYNAATASVVAISSSTVDNVEHLYVPGLSPGRYDLEVLKNGGFTGNANVVSASETYALAWSAPLLGDANWDGTVDFQDLTIIANHWQTQQRSTFNGDLNGDGIVDFQDLTLVANNWQSTTSMAQAAAAGGFSLVTDSSGSSEISLSGVSAQGVPEPAALSLLASGGSILLLRRRSTKTAGRA